MKRILLLVTVGLMLGAAMALSGVAQAQSDPEPPCGEQFCIDKTADPNPAIVGESITFTISERCFNAGGCSSPQNLIDTLPPEAGLTNVSVDDSDPNIQCTTSGNTVTCPGGRDFTTTAPFTLTIVATPTECGTFTNTVSKMGVNTVNFTATATFTVVGCAPPLPMTKEECKNGGFEEFGYPNQGTCISDVNRRNRQ